MELIKALSPKGYYYEEKEVKKAVKNIIAFIDMYPTFSNIKYKEKFIEFFGKEVVEDE